MGCPNSTSVSLKVQYYVKVTSQLKEEEEEFGRFKGKHTTTIKHYVLAAV